MNYHTTKTRSEQRLEQLINAGRPLTDEESDELYRVLHADYMRKWRLARKSRMQAQHRTEELRLLERVQEEAGW